MPADPGNRSQRRVRGVAMRARYPGARPRRCHLGRHRRKAGAEVPESLYAGGLNIAAAELKKPLV